MGILSDFIRIISKKAEDGASSEKRPPERAVVDLRNDVPGRIEIVEKISAAVSPESPAEEPTVLGRTGLKGEVLALIGNGEEVRTLLDGRKVLLEKFVMTTGSFELGGQYNFVLHVTENGRPGSHWMYKFNFENESGALALDSSLRPRRIQDGEFTADIKKPAEAIADIEAVIDELLATRNRS